MTPLEQYYQSHRYTTDPLLLMPYKEDRCIIGSPFGARIWLDTVLWKDLEAEIKMRTEEAYFRHAERLAREQERAENSLPNDLEIPGLNL